MNSRGKIEKWLLNDWSSGRSNLELSKTSNEGVTGKCERKNDEQTAEVEGENKNSNANESASGIGNKVTEEGQDFSPSGSSWVPTDGSSSSDDSDTEAVQSKTLKMEQYIRQFVKRRNGKKIPTPIHRPDAVVKVLQERQTIENNKSLNDTRKRKYQESLVNYKFQPDSTRKNISPPKGTVDETINISKKEILEIKSSFEELFKMLNDMKPQGQRQNYIDNKNIGDEFVQVNKRELSLVNEEINASYRSEHSDRSQSEESNRSDDNVLITNKYHKARESPENRSQNSHKENEWVPIGSGKTLIHKDKYRKVNWKSYTIATRTLLLATFPRRILATHSLTGKRSPAFQNKPAKMCLDPKIVSDIIIEITSKFKVKENLVRGIITTKCADECKMLKMRLKNKPLKGFNAPPQRTLKEECNEGL